MKHGHIQYTPFCMSESFCIAKIYHIHLFAFPPGHSRDTPLHQDLQLEQREHLLPHHHWQPSARQQAVVRNFTGETDGDQFVRV